MIRHLKPKDLKSFVHYCQHRDSYSDFYITQDNKRLFLSNVKIAKQVFYDCLKRGNKCYVKEENNEIKAVLLVVGYKDKFKRKYVKVLAQNKKDFQDLLNYLDWQRLPNLFVKVQKNNKNFVKYNEETKRYKPSYILKKYGFIIIAVREKEVLLKKEDKNREYRKYNDKRN